MWLMKALFLSYDFRKLYSQLGEMKTSFVKRYIIPKSLYTSAAEVSRCLSSIEIIVIVFITAITTV